MELNEGDEVTFFDDVNNDLYEYKKLPNGYSLSKLKTTQ